MDKRGKSKLPSLLLFKDLYGSQNYSNLLSVIPSKTDQKNLHSP